MKRRPFLKLAGGVLGGCTLGLNPSFGAMSATDGIVDRVNGLPYRMLGRTGMKVSIVGYPCLALNNQEQDACNQAIVKAYEGGINYFDVAPAYGNAEIKLGPALQQLNRSDYFLACKTKKRDKEGARQELERSLERLHTDHFDVYQLHHLRMVEEVQEAFGTGGAIETILEAQKAGKIRHIGFSAHTTKAAMEAMKLFKFDTVMFPINYVEHYVFDFGSEVLAEAEKQGAAVLAIKPISAGIWPEGVEQSRKYWYRPLEEEDQINLAMSFALSKPGVVMGVPVGFFDITETVIKACHNYHIPTEADIEKLKDMAAESLSLFKDKQDNPSRAMLDWIDKTPCPYQYC